ncbi:TATA box-binding protein-associated factor RNA polymerase I subunit C [Geranomyces michiganensis]|nr:TATA box-binding protein-associated factor RNA polymerase I subunit C [Geranomyces michiganensis]
MLGCMAAAQHSSSTTAQQPPLPPREYPIWSFPRSTTLSVGALGGFSPRFPHVDFASDLDPAHSGWRSLRRNPPTLFLPPCRPSVHQRPPSNLDPSRSGELLLMARYYESLGAPSIPRDLIVECLDETYQVERELEDPFLGNCLGVVDDMPGVDDGPTVVFSRGTAFGDVCVAEFATGCGNAIARFRNPVLQVLTGGAVPGGKSKPIPPCVICLEKKKRLLAVRNHASASILAFGRKHDDDVEGESSMAWESQKVDVLPFEHRPLDLAINPILPAEVAILLDGGDISIWNGERETRCYPIAKYDQAPAPYELKRKSCQYGAHPRSLIVAHVDRVDIVDFRSSSIRPATIFESRSELVHAFQRDPRDQFRMVIATTARTALIDTRFHSRTMLEWDYQNNREAPCSVEFMPPVDNDPSASFVTWARISGEIQAYTYGSPAARMPERVAMQSDDHDGATLLPSVHELISPSWTAPPVSLARPSQLDPCRRSPQHPFFQQQRRFQKSLWAQHVEKEEDPGWPSLRGLALSRRNGGDSSKAVLLQLADDGAMYSQPIVNRESAIDDSDQPEVLAESRELDVAIDDDVKEDAILKYKAHHRKDWRDLAKFLRFAALKVDRAFESSLPAPLELVEFLTPEDDSRCTTL